MIVPEWLMGFKKNDIENNHAGKTHTSVGTFASFAMFVKRHWMFVGFLQSISEV